MIMELNKRFVNDTQLEDTNFKQFEIIGVKSEVADTNGDLPNQSNGSIENDLDFNGFETASVERLNHLLNLIKDLESDILNCEVETIDGIEFYSFYSELDLMAFSRNQQDQRVNGSQSDDGLEILDDGSFSDISSTHAIVPTKTKDITRIKGWRNKHFVGMQDLGDSGSSFKNDDDGFGDDAELKSVHNESSEEVDSVDSPIPRGSRCGFESESCNGVISTNAFEQSVFKNNPQSSRSPDFEDSNAKTQSFITESSSLLPQSNDAKEDLSTGTSNKVKCTDLSFNNKIDIAHKTPSSEETRLVLESTFSKKIDESAQFPAIAYKDTSVNDLGNFPLNNILYKPRVKHSLIESISRKINAINDPDFVQEQNSPIKTNEEVIRWHVPKEKLLCGNIYDLEVSLSSTDSKCNLAAENCIEKTTNLDSIIPVQKVVRIRRASSIKDTNIFAKHSSGNGAFHSNTLDEYTTNLDKLHIDFTIPKLDAADNVTHEEVTLPNEGITKLTPIEPNRKQVILVKAKTVAERKRLLEEMNHQRAKRKKKLSFKLRDQSNTKPVQHGIRKKKQSQINLDKKKMVTHENSKKLMFEKELFDDHGVITYGKEKPLKCLLKNNLKYMLQRKSLSVSANISKTKSEIAIVVNVGFKRPLYKEVADCVAGVLNNEGTISQKAAEFAVSAVQFTNKPFKVTRILVPVIDTNLKSLMYSYKEQQLKLENTGLIRSSRKLELVKKSNLDFDRRFCNKISVETKTFVEEQEIDPEVCKTVSDIIDFVERKDVFHNMTLNYDPLIPPSIEKETSMLPSSTLQAKVSEKTKKTKLQRQIERLGGTFIEVREEEETDKDAPVNLQNENCSKEHCKYGCVCMIKMATAEHCGKESCMFSCQCSDTSKKQVCEIKSKIWLLPEVLRKRNTLQRKMAPVEREYHQTVIMSENKKTITIESQHKKRERKIPSKYKDEILLGYGMEDDPNILNIIKSLKPVHEECVLNKKKNQPKLCSIQSLDSFLKLQKIYTQNSIAENMKLCYVKIEKLNNLNYATSQTSSRDYFKEKNGNTSGFLKCRTRNVAVKRTGGPSHCRMTENSCCRTFGVSDYYNQRNLMCKIKTRDMILYSGQSNNFSSYHSFFFQPDNNDSHVIKEDLEFAYENDVLPENELVCLENVQEDEGNKAGLEIDFICSLPPELFEKQDSVDYEETSNTILLPANNSSINISQNNNSAHIPDHPHKRKNETIVYASLPTTDTECKWWVVEMDYRKFSNLIYVSDKRSLSLDDMSKATFNAAFGETTVHIPLTKSQGNYREMFGAYAVPRHNHLMFFGPYDLNEDHGFTAMKSTSGGCNSVPFTSTFSDSEQFKKLGIDLSQNKKSKVSSHRVKAVWWYSTPKKSVPIVESYNAEFDQTVDKASSHNLVEMHLSSPPNDILMREYERDDMSNEHSVSPMNGLTSTDQDLRIKGMNNKIRSADSDHNPALPCGESINESSQVKRRRRKRNKLLFTPIGRKPLQKCGKKNAKSMEINHPQILNQSKQTNNLIIDLECNSNSSESEIEHHTGSTMDFCPSNNRFEGIAIETLVHKPKKDSRSSNIRDEADSVPISKALLHDKPFPGPYPQLALLCLRPGIGYIPVVQLHQDRKILQNQKIVIRDPVKNYVDHQFSNVSQASDWLNKYFKTRQIYNEHSVLKWVLVKGSIIKYLKPFDPDVFKRNSKKVEASDNQYGQSILTRNELERKRRNNQTYLTKKLAFIVLPEHETVKFSVNHVLRSAYYMIKAQTLISMEVTKQELELEKRRSMLNTRLRNIISSLPHEERNKAIELCKFVKCKTWKYMEKVPNEQRYSQSTKLQELDLIDKIKEMPSSSKWIVNPEKLVEMSAEYSNWRNSSNSNLEDTSQICSSLEELALNLTQNRTEVQPTESFLIHEKKPNSNSATESRPGTSSQNNSNIISLIDSDDEDNKGKVIEIESDEDDVVWIPEESSSIEEDIQLPRKRRRMEFPKPNEKLPRFGDVLPSQIHNNSFHKIHNSFTISQRDEQSSEQTNNSSKNINDPNSTPVIIAQPQGNHNVSPVALVISDTVLQKQKRIIQVPEPEFVGVDDQYDTLQTSNNSNDVDLTLTGCSRTDPVPQTYLSRCHPKFLPINETQRINIVNNPSPTVVNSLKTPDEILHTPTKNATLNQTVLNSVPSSSSTIVLSPESKFKTVHVQQTAFKKMLECKSMVPIGKVNFVKEIKGKQVLVRLPRSAMSMPVSNAGVSLLKNPSVRPVPYFKPILAAAERDNNTLTLHHPSKQISETRTVQFASMNTVNMTSHIKGPKMHIPKASNQLKVILPKPF